MRGSIQVLIARDNRKKALFAHVVPVKGVNEAVIAVKAIIDDIACLGYTKVALNTDSEPAILKLPLEVAPGPDD